MTGVIRLQGAGETVHRAGMADPDLISFASERHPILEEEGWYPFDV